jgi:glycosyltransferase involved in cell wall biosynthesis
MHEQVHALVARLSLTDVVRFHGFLPVDALPAFYQRAHLYLQSSRHESQGVAVCEAGAAGVPTVGTAVGLVAELAPDAAQAVPIGDHVALAGAVLDLLSDHGRRMQLGEAARTWAHAHDADWTARMLEAIYQESKKA